MRVVRLRNRLPREVVHAPSLEKVQSQVGWGFEQSDLVKDVPAQGGEGWTTWSSKVPSNPNDFVTLWFCDLEV